MRWFLDYAKKDGNIFLMTAAAAGGQLRALKWLYHSTGIFVYGPDFMYYPVLAATVYGHTDVLAWLHRHGMLASFASEMYKVSHTWGQNREEVMRFYRQEVMQ